MLQEKVRQFARQTGALRGGQLYLAGVSGGVDSVALLHALRAVAPDLGIGLHVAHLDHGLRGEDSAADAAFVAALAAEWGLPATVERADASAYAGVAATGEEAAARAVRYAFFARLSARLGAEGVVVGHTADDQAETVVLHFLRGAGLAGLRGMAPVRRLRLPSSAELTVLRPFLGVGRAAVEAYAAAHALAFRQDATNEESRYLRNRVRRELMPLLEAYNPALRAALARLADLAAADYAYLETGVQAAWDQVSERGMAGVTLALAPLLAQPLALRRMLVRRAYAELVGEAVDLEAAHVEAVLGLAAAGRTGAQVHLTARVSARRTYGRLLITQGEMGADPLPVGGVTLRLPGLTVVEPGGWLAQAEVTNALPPGGGDPYAAVFDAERLGGDLVVRRRRAGDRLRPRGLGGTRKVQDILVDRKVPRWERDRVPVVASPSGVVWLVGLAVDEQACPDADTKRFLCLRFSKRGLS